MIALYVLGCIVCFWIGFFFGVLFETDGQAPRPEVKQLLFRNMDNSVDWEAEDKATAKWLNEGKGGWG